MPSGFNAVEVNVLQRHDEKPMSAPPVQVTPAIDRKSLFRKSTSNRKDRRKTKLQSCTSLHSLVSTLNPSITDQRSAPNVTQVSRDNSSVDDYNDISINISKNSLNVTLNPSIDDSSQFQYGLESEENLRIPGGSFSTQTSTIGFRASFFSVLEKLGVWRSQEIYKPSQTTNELRFQPSSKPQRSSVTSLYFRTIYGGKYYKNSSLYTFFNSNLLQNTCEFQF